MEVYKRGRAHYFFAYPEDYGRTQIEYEHGRFERRPHRPAFEVIFVYSQTDGTLDTYFRGRRQTVRDLQEIFGRVVLQRELGDPAKDERVYELNRLKPRDFNFIYDAGSGIQDVSVRLLRLSLLGERGRRITIEADPSRWREAIYDLLDQVTDGGSGAHARKSSANFRQKGLANSVVAERYYVPGGEVAVPGGTGLEPEVKAMCALLGAVSLRLNRERAVNRARLRVVK